eukprot:TCALIF_06701-PA protein Name:"Similar to P4ha3 Prolyl 4-hydroxylase subunit alpha-3 (Mus musculus)" AED:0.43 eAED:0.43 QI:0/-1/0/1/-1/1/1/0/479
MEGLLGDPMATYDQAVMGLLVLRETYNLPMDDFMAGIVKTKSHTEQVFQGNHALNLQDAFHLAIKAQQRKWFDAGILFLRQANQMLKSMPEGELSTLDSEFLDGMDVLKKYLIQSQNHYLKTRKAIFGLDYRILPYFVDNNLEKRAKQPKFVRALGEYTRLLNDTNEYLEGERRDEADRRICRGEYQGSSIDKEVHLQLCHYLHQSNPYLRLGPFKMEVVARVPFRMILHDFMDEAEIRWLIDYAKPRLSRNRSKIKSNEDIQANSLDRSKVKIIAKTTQAWISSRLFIGKDIYDDMNQLQPNPHLDKFIDIHPNLVTLSRKIEMATKMIVLKRFSATEFQVTNYGLSGLCEGHIDPHGYLEGKDLTPDRQGLVMSGDMLGTFMAWLDDVEAGGGTAFDSPGYEQIVRPTRGSAAFWIDLRPNGIREAFSSHMGCPILKGSKWILNKWIYYFDQVHNYKCGLAADSKFDVFNDIFSTYQ